MLTDTIPISQRQAGMALQTQRLARITFRTHLGSRAAQSAWMGVCATRERAASRNAPAPAAPRSCAAFDVNQR